MKKFLSCFLSVALALVTACGFAGCFGSDGGGGDDDKPPVVETPKEYEIQYTDDSGVHKLTVTDGALYSLDAIPEKTGYIFMGLFDAEIGGNQYVSASGSALAPFTDGKSIVLFPVFKAKQYTVILDFQGAPVTGDRQHTVEYGNNLPNLPLNLTSSNKEFAGWYTKPDCGGVQIADQYGLVPVVSVLNEQNFDLSGSNITLYAGFSAQKYSVTCYFGNGVESETIEVEYGTPVKDIVPKTRVDGKAPVSWSQTSGGTPFTGKIENTMTLHALEYAPVIDFDTDGGKELIPLVARAGSTVALPVPTKALATFVYWEDAKGNKYEQTKMPENSISLKAVWQAKLEFDENGGSDVNDISVKAGETIKLPVPEKEGFIFAGWYTADKTQYTSTKMPSAGVVLKAGWYKAALKVFGNGTKEGHTGALDPGEENKQSADWRNEYDLSDILPSTGGNIHVKLTQSVRLQKGEGGRIMFGEYFYDSAIIGGSYVLGGKTLEVNTTASRELTYEANLAMKSNTLYIVHYGKNVGTKWDRAYFMRVSLEITYPDTTNLYL